MCIRDSCRVSAGELVGALIEAHGPSGADEINAVEDVPALLDATGAERGEAGAPGPWAVADACAREGDAGAALTHEPALTGGVVPALNGRFGVTAYAHPEEGEEGERAERAERG